ncbi:MAG: hypothetical protein AVDCRST_MAG08-2679 [uncultured Acetobacteraceae bacterium]|jgi:hypothetical protein|uniref:Uncharacterized protein n=1 Tax=uncultured Acetobacteraceae bacterium TaxID=169975 RepID=A0A6J4IX52_9PROT|nr:MAG: hypothetical protein AVDCRST_MAG08-2679 [uncultured Acetobacteraceae bacterium]
MRSQALEHCVLAFTVIATLFWLDLVPTAVLQEAVVVLLGWAAFSTLLVASAGAWVAFARARAEARSRPRQHLTPHRG